MSLMPMIVLVCITTAPTDEAPIGHRAGIIIDPLSGELSVVDTVDVGSTGPDLGFALNRSLDVEPIPGVIITDPDTAARADIPGDVARVVRLEAVAGGLPDPLVICYSGTLRHDFEGRGSYARGFETTAGIIDSSGVFLSGSSYWLPTVPDRMMTFELHVSLPPGWAFASEGIEIREGPIATWRCEHPMEEAHLVAGRFHRYQQPCGNVSALAYLLSADSTLAQTYLDATCRYLALYDSMIGPYAYGKFALVENFWQTGYGMPSFTLLGSQVIRLPFIVHTSYGHEILHNWFGNGVYVDYESGNWCEGITAYLADHYYKELAGQGRDYRFRQLQNYAWYARGGEDLPLTDFRERHSSATEAIGYGKSTMLFHMLRRELGDETFFTGLRDFYRDNLHRRATWSDLSASFSRVAASPLDHFFHEWTTRTGGPSLRVDLAERTAGGLRLVVSQGDPPYDLRVPVEVTVAERDTMRTHLVILPFSDTRLDTILEAIGAVRRVVVDPEYDIFRLLRPGESPPALGRILGADRLTVLTGSHDSLIANAWPAEGTIRFVEGPLHGVGTGMIVGDGPDVRAAVAPFFHRDLLWVDDLIVVEADSIPITSTVITVGEYGSDTLCWIRPAAGADSTTLAAVMARVVHYGSAGLLSFDGIRTDLKKTWPVRHNPMIVEFAGEKAAP